MALQQILVDFQIGVSVVALVSSSGSSSTISIGSCCTISSGGSCGRC